MSGQLPKPAVGDRVFLKRKALKRLRSYWARRWDNLELRRHLALGYEPKYHIESDFLNGLYVKLVRLDFLWFYGLFSLGRHLPSGRYYRDPVHLPLGDLGPRELVFPISLMDHLGDLTLLGNGFRYQLSARGYLAQGESPEWNRKLAAQGDRVTIEVSEVLLTRPPPIVTRWGLRKSHSETVCLRGEATSSDLEGLELLVPIDEIHWNSLPGYSRRYLSEG